MQSEETKENVRILVKDGRLEIAGGGWSMHDEACPSYSDMMNNIMYGHEFIERELGVRPRVGWQIDTFGHTASNARLYAEMGFESWFFARFDRSDKKQRESDQSLQFIWKPFDKSLGEPVEIFTHCMHDHYNYPDDFKYDEVNTSGDPFVSNPKLSTFNADVKSEKLRIYINRMTTIYKS